MKYLFLILLIPGMALADLPYTPRLTVVPGTQYVNGDPFPSFEVVENRIYCASGAAFPIKTDTVKYVLTMPQLEITTKNADWAPFGPWNCGSTTVATNGEESELSSPLTVFTVAPNQPAAPELIVQ